MGIKQVNLIIKRNFANYLFAEDRYCLFPPTIAPSNLTQSNTLNAIHKELPIFQKKEMLFVNISVILITFSKCISGTDSLAVFSTGPFLIKNLERETTKKCNFAFQIHLMWWCYSRQKATRKHYIIVTKRKPIFVLSLGTGCSF